MAWVKLDDGFSDHPKIEALSDAAVRAFIAGLCHCGRFLTDGVISGQKAAQIAKPKVRAELVASGLWALDEASIRVHDFLDWNRDAATVKAERQANADRQKRKRDRERHGVTDDVTNAVSNGTQSSPVQSCPVEDLTAAADYDIPNIGDPVIRLLISLKDADDRTENVIRALVAAHHLSEGDLMYAKECADGPGVRSPAAVAVAELKKRAERAA